MEIPKYSPWGAIQHHTIIADGVAEVHTATHGGLKLDRRMNAKIPGYLRRAGGWYEEDSEWCIPAVVFPGIFLDKVEQASKEFRNSYPDEYERLTGKVLTEGESRKRDEAIFMERHKGDLIAFAASNQFGPDVVKVWAAIGGRKRTPPYTVPEAQRAFLVPADEYAKRGRFGFVVDPAKYQEVSL